MKTARKIILSIAAVLLFVLCFFSFIFCGNEWFYTYGGDYFDAETQEAVARVLGLELAPGEELSALYSYGFWPGSISELLVSVDGIVSKEDFLSRCSDETLFHVDAYDYGDEYHASASVGRGDGLIRRELARTLGGWGFEYLLPFLGLCGGLLGEAALLIVAIIGRVKRRKARKEQSDGALPSRTKGARKFLRVLVRVLAVVLVPVMTVLTLGFLAPLSEGGKLMSTTLDDEQQKELARLIGFELARGEEMDLRLYDYKYFAADELYIYVYGVVSEEEFLVRFHTYELKEKPEWVRWDSYALYGNDDIILGFGLQPWFNVTGRTGKPAVHYVRGIIWRNSAKDRFDFVLPYLTIFGWLAEFALIIVPLVMRGKSKKEKMSAGVDGAGGENPPAPS